MGAAPVLRLRGGVAALDTVYDIYAMREAIGLVVAFLWHAAVVVAVIIGAAVFVRHSPSISYGIAQELEKEGRLDRALVYYQRMERYARSDFDRKVARQSIWALRSRGAGGAPAARPSPGLREIRAAARSALSHAASAVRDLLSQVADRR